MKTIESMCHKSQEQTLWSERRVGSSIWSAVVGRGHENIAKSKRMGRSAPAATERKAVLYLGWKIKVD